MSFHGSMRRIAHWLDRGEEALEYEPDCGIPAVTPAVAWEPIHERIARLYPEGIVPPQSFPLVGHQRCSGAPGVASPAPLAYSAADWTVGDEVTVCQLEEIARLPWPVNEILVMHMPMLDASEE